VFGDEPATGPLAGVVNERIAVDHRAM